MEKEVFYTRLNNNIFYSHDLNDQILVKNINQFKFDDYDLIKKKYFSLDQKFIGIRAIICFIEGKYDEFELWEKYGLDTNIFNQIKKIQEFLNLEAEEYHLISEELQYQFGFEYLKLIKYLYKDYFQ